METALGTMAKEEFVTIVSVGSTLVEPDIPKSDFVTVLSIGQQPAVEEEVVVYRLPGEKLGFGLKFEGGTKSAECVRRLFIQSCAPETPAGRAKASWGPLDAGDEILCIDRVSVTALTRLECVRCLKDSNVAVKLIIRHFGNHDSSESDRASLPPPVPPRKIPRKKESANQDVSITTNGTSKVISTLEINHDQQRKGPLGRQSPGRPRRPNAPPPEAQYYIDVTKENGVHIESESDDTGSSISTVIDRLSAYSSFPGSVENSIPSTPTLGTKQINNLLNGKFDENFLTDISTRVIDHFKDSKITSDIFNEISNRIEEPPNNVVITLNAVKMEEINDANNNTKVEPKTVIPKPLPRNLIKKNVDHLVHGDEFDETNRPYDDNLSPTKLQNIETWLKDAIGCNLNEEAEKTEVDNGIKPEALPRLIDFVPKLKSEEEVYSVKVSINVNKQPVVVAEEADWSYEGDSSPQLETIGEDDEDSPNCLTLPIIKVTHQSPTTNGEPIQRSPIEPTKSPKLSPKLPPKRKEPEVPTVSVNVQKPEKEPDETGVKVVSSRGPRSPPDGRENPAIHQETPPNFPNAAPPPPKLQESMNIQKPSPNFSKEKAFSEQFHQRSISYEPMQPKPKIYGRGKDAKSEGSVKDKIAMFQSQKSLPEKRNSITKPPIELRNNSQRLYSDSLSKSYESLLDSVTIKAPDLPKSNPPRLTNGSANKITETLPKSVTSYYDTAKQTENKYKAAPFTVRDIQTCAKNESHKSTIDHLIEQRRKSMTKLRGLVIPDSPCIADLPEIRSKDSLKILSSSILDRTSTLDRSPVKKPVSTSTLTSMWDTQSFLNIIPKYSPAFKRKPLQVYGPKTKSSSPPLELVLSNRNPPPRIDNHFEKKCPLIIQAPLKSFDTVDSNKIFKAFSDTADSDNDSAVSSTQSSYLSTVSSPTPSLNTVDNTESDCSSQSTLSRCLNNKTNGKRNVCRSISSDTSTSIGSNSSTLTSGSQASCSSAGSSNPDSHRVLKPRSIEAINRKNILASAKCRSGKDNKFGSPLIERKFSDDSTDECEPKFKDQDMVKYHNNKNRSHDPVLKIAFATLVEDKCSLNGNRVHHSDTDSDCETNKPIKMTKKFGTLAPQSVKEAFVIKPVLEPPKSKRSTSNTSEEEDDQECFEVRLPRACGGSVGVILAGGIDCEAKEVTIHKVLQGSAAERDGRLCKGDRVISINGQTMRGMTHAQSVTVLKDPQPEVSIIVRGKQPASPEKSNNYTPISNDSTPTISVELQKADAPGGAGLGISLQGGGNRPLLINKLFTGGAAAQSGKIVSGSELLAAGGTKLVGLTRTEAWGLLRALPAGPVTLVLRPP